MNTTPHIFQPESFPLRQPDGRALLPEGHTLLVVPLLDVALLLDWPAQRLLAGGTFFEEEWLLLLPILRAWPASVSYPRLLARLEHGPLPAPAQLAAMQQRYRAALEAGTQDTLLAPLRARLHASQGKLARFSLKLGAVYQHGLVLLHAPGAFPPSPLPSHSPQEEQES